MTYQQLFLLALLAVVLVLFVWERVRYDVVAFGALLAATLAGTVPYTEMFSGFGHPATVTVALVLIISRGLQNSGAVDLIARYLLPPVASPSRHVGILTSVAGALSTMMNNVGALALLMPAAIRSAVKAKRSPAAVLMPLAFGSLLGGLVTLIGTPPNIIVASFREEAVGEAFGMFDFTPVGGPVAVVGIVFIALVGWRLIPEQRRARLSSSDLFDIENYVSEAGVPRGSASIGRPLRDLDDTAAEHDAVILGLIRRKRRIDRPDRRQHVHTGDILIIEAGPEALDAVIAGLELKLPGVKKGATRLLRGGDTTVVEAVVLPRSAIEGMETGQVRLRHRFGVNLIAVSRRGHSFRGRVRSFRMQSGDVLLLEGDPERLPEVIAALGCLPLAERSLQVGQPRPPLLAIALFAAAIVGASVGWLSIPAALGVAVVAMVVLNIVPPRDIYESVDWPVVVLVGAMIPVGTALQTTGTTEMLVHGLIALGAGFPPAVLLSAMMIVTMTLSAVINNAATAVVMAPIAMATARDLGVNADPFLMAVAIGASCAFVTPIGHQNNTLILGPGGYRFGDYWRMGLPLEVLIVAVAVPLILWAWPL
jgi:di/tricarboxylate transporter